MARDLDNDPEQLSLLCLPLLRYAEAHGAYKRAKDPVEDLKAWEGSKVMAEVERNAFDLRHERIHPRSDVEGCAGCAKARSSVG